MNDQLRIGILGLSHDHAWYNLPFVDSHEDLAMVAAADPNEPLTSRAAEDYGCKTYNDPADLLENEVLDGVYIFSSNKEGAELAIEALNRKLHVLIEKPMAASLDQANKMSAAAEENGVKLIVNWPFAWWPQLQKALSMAGEGAIGKLWGVKYRAAHAGPAELGCSEYFCNWLFNPELNGAGALMDYCCYGCLLSATLLGLPEEVTGFTGGQVKDSISVDDNALIAMRYPFGLSTAEASWTQTGKLTSYTTALYGTEGTIMVEPRIGGRLFLATKEDPTGSEAPVLDPEPHLKNSANHFFNVVANEGSHWLLCDPKNARNAQEILEAGLQSVREARHIQLPL